MRFWFALDYGSVYAVLRTLDREGLVRSVGEEREGARPVRRRYAITRAGRAALRDLLRETWMQLPDRGAPIDLALAAISDLEEEEIDPLLEKRAAAIRGRLDELGSLARSAPSPELVARHEALARAELAWAESFLDRRVKERRRDRAASNRRAADREPGHPAT
jgi:DNA-binding PadR family transcriptional regulator